MTMLIEKKLLKLINQNHKEYADNGMLRISLLQSEVMQLMANAKTIEEAKEIYSTYRNVSYNNPL